MEGPEITFAEAVIDNGTFGTRTIRFETGRLAKQADGAVVAYLDDETMIMSTTAAGRTPKDQFDFFPLTVDVEERMYAIGKIPGSFFRREGRPSPRRSSPAASSTARCARPSSRGCATRSRSSSRSTPQPRPPVRRPRDQRRQRLTQISGLPFSGPIGGVRVSLHRRPVGRLPQLQRRRALDLRHGRRRPDRRWRRRRDHDGRGRGHGRHLGSRQERGQDRPDRGGRRQGLEAAKKFIRVLCEAQADLAAKAAKETIEFPRFLDYQDDVYAAVEAAASPRTGRRPACTIAGKQEREDKLNEIKSALHLELVGDADGIHEGGPRSEPSTAARRRSPRHTGLVQKKLVRQRILRDEVRIDGRGLRDIRALSAEVEVLPRVHGSAIFERGETQIMGVTTLNMLKMEQQLDTLSPVTRKRYMHNYNFPPYSTGETGRVGSPKRREIGHGALAERALMPVLPTREEFPYAIRQVSEALGLQRLDVDGFGLRLHLVAAQRRCAAARSGRRHRDGPGLRRPSTGRPGMPR
jgi:polyribonucleotide nucleotidyltransferase